MDRDPPTPPAAAATPPSVVAALAYIHAHFELPLRLDELAAEAGLSPWRLCTVFRHATGTPPQRYIRALRVRHARALLDSGVQPARAATQVGFYDQSHLSRHFKAECGMTPGQYLARGRLAAAADRAAAEPLPS